MKLLFDQNLSPRLWAFARMHGIVTKDSDFSEMSLLRGFPPKVVWLRIGNSSMQAIEALLRLHKPILDALESNPNTGIIELV